MGTNTVIPDEVELRIEMLGGFAIFANGKRITEQVKRSSKIWKLIQYLIVYRHKIIPQDELITVFCSDEEISNPGSALRTMVYRARAALEGSGLPNADDMILSGGGGYRWNNSVKCTIDAEEFENLLKQVASLTEKEERLKLILEAADLYKGEFLTNSSGELWVIPLARWYRSAFISSVYEALGILTETGRGDEAEGLCAKAMRTDPFDEGILEYHLLSLVEQGKNLEALDQYKKTEAMFYDVLGVNFSDNLRELQNRLQRPDKKEDIPLENTLTEWLHGADFPGAYYCDVSVFKSVCQIEARSAARSGRTAYIIRFDIVEHDDAVNSNLEKQLGATIPQTLRKGDLFTLSAPGQFMVMLNSLKYEDCRMLIDRILGAMDLSNLHKMIKTSIKPIKPIV